MGAEHLSHDVTAYYRDDATLRSRSVGTTVLSGRLDVPAPTAHLQADWRREIVRLELENGDVEPLSLPRARARWPDYRLCLQAMTDWMTSLGMAASFASSEVALMACIGTHYHHDAKHYGGLAFGNLFLGAQQALDLHFPALKLRIPLELGSAVVFDTGQPHAVIVRDHSSVTSAAVALGQDFSQMFLTWELPIHNPDVARGLGVRFDTDATGASQQRDEGVWVSGMSALVCPDSGHWIMRP